MTTDSVDHHCDAIDEPQEISKSQLKREMVELQKLGAQLVEMTDKQLAKLDIPGELRQAIGECPKRRGKELPCPLGSAAASLNQHDPELGPIR